MNPSKTKLIISKTAYDQLAARGTCSFEIFYRWGIWWQVIQDVTEDATLFWGKVNCLLLLPVSQCVTL